MEDDNIKSIENLYNDVIIVWSQVYEKDVQMVAIIPSAKNSILSLKYQIDSYAKFLINEFKSIDDGNCYGVIEPKKLLFLFLVYKQLGWFTKKEFHGFLKNSIKK